MNPPQTDMNVHFARGDGVAVTATSSYRVTSDATSSNITIFHDEIIGVPGGGDPTEVIIATFDIPVGPGVQPSGNSSLESFDVTCQIVEYRSVSSGPNYVVQAALEPYEISTSSVVMVAPGAEISFKPDSSDNPFTSDSAVPPQVADGEGLTALFTVQVPEGRTGAMRFNVTSVAFSGVTD